MREQERSSLRLISDLNARQVVPFSEIGNTGEACFERQWALVGHIKFKLLVIPSGADTLRSGLEIQIWKTFEYEDPSGRWNRPEVPGNSMQQAYLQIFKCWSVVIISIIRSFISVSEKVQTKWLKNKTKRTLPWVYQLSSLAVNLRDRSMVSSISKSHVPQTRSSVTFWKQ